MKYINTILAFVLALTSIFLFLYIPELVGAKISITKIYQAVFLGSVWFLSLVILILPARLKKLLFVNLVLLYGCLVVVDYGLYAILYKASQQDRPIERCNVKGPLELIRDLRNDGIQAYLAGGPTYEITGTSLERGELVPIAGISNTHYVFCNENDGFIQFLTDQYGFRNNKRWTEGTDIVILGDSYGHGACVVHGQSISGWLERKYEVLNLSISGNGPLEMLAIQKEYAKLVRPKYTVWLFYAGNDIGNLGNTVDGAVAERGLIQYLEEKFSQNLVGRQKEINELVAAAFDEKYNEIFVDNVDRDSDCRVSALPFNKSVVTVFILENLSRFIWNRGFVSEPFEYSNRVWSIFSNVLHEAKDTAEKMDSTLVMVLLHSVHSYKESWILTNRVNLAKKARIHAEKLGIPVFDTYPRIKSLKPGPDAAYAFGWNGGHHNGKGYEIVSEVIDDAIIQIEGE